MAGSQKSVFLSFHAEITPQTSEALISVVTQQMLQGKTDVHLLLSTPGGQVGAGIATYNDQGQIAAIICKRTVIDSAEVESLFLKAAFMLPAEAQTKGIVHEVRDVRIPLGTPVLQLVFQR